MGIGNFWGKLRLVVRAEPGWVGTRCRILVGLKASAHYSHRWALAGLWGDPAGKWLESSRDVSYSCHVSGELPQIFRALAEGGVQYLVVGGVAVVLHGYPRMTADLDLVLSLASENVVRAVNALSKLGFQPRPPVPFMDFADAAKRREWIEDKGLTVFSLWSPQFPLTEIDCFVAEPFPFAEAYGRALSVPIAGIEVWVVGLVDLISLKRIAGRPKDLDDIEKLQAIHADSLGSGVDHEK